MTLSPEDPLKYHGGRPDELYREEYQRGEQVAEDERLFAPGGFDDRQPDAADQDEVDGGDEPTAADDETADQPAARSDPRL